MSKPTTMGAIYQSDDESRVYHQADRDYGAGLITLAQRNVIFERVNAKTMKRHAAEVQAARAARENRN